MNFFTCVVDFVFHCMDNHFTPHRVGPDGRGLAGTDVLHGITAVAELKEFLSVCGLMEVRCFHGITAVAEFLAGLIESIRRRMWSCLSVC